MGCGSDGLPISDNNVSTTNDALDAGEWDVPETEADIDVSLFNTGETSGVETNGDIVYRLPWLPL